MKINLEKHDAPGKPDTHMGLERLVFFSDAVMAIAITLLAIELKLPEIEIADSGQLAHQLLEMSGRFIGFLISFGVIGLYWVAHHWLFSYIRRYDVSLLWLNLIFLLGITFLPFTTGILGSHLVLSLARTVYASTVAFIGLSSTALWIYATRKRRLVDRELDARLIRRVTIRSLIPPLLFLLSIPLARLAPGLTLLLWSLTAVASILTRVRTPRET